LKSNSASSSTERIAGKIAIVTGASSGIGRATALALASAGAHVALAARGAGALYELADGIRALGREALVVPTDVTQQSEVQRLIDETLTRWGRVDILVANAGEYVRASVEDLSIAHIERSLAVNFYGASYAVLGVLPIMRQQQGGHIVLVSSMDARLCLPLDAPYIAAKCALSGLGDVLRQELFASGIDVTTVFPGRVDTPLIETLEVPAVSAKIPAEAVAQAILRAIRRRQAEVMVPAQAKTLYYIKVLFPRLGDWLIRQLRLQGWAKPESKP
jgi:NADP-dependent 3-hydroxy acid dehydrogenase YdfG